ncbi:CHAT domain-containing protein [Amycolatopsis sp. NPDC051903]|uniref:CHAT domain-containing protein n=1 Tax=Amycolatopsis sp. NPDC051903 TaxID=3363936 RepID=UPI0037A669E0
MREAVSTCRAAVALTAADHPDHGRYVGELRRLLLRLLESTTDLDPRDLEQALRWSHPLPGEPTGTTGEAVAGLAELAAALRREFEQTDDLPTLRDAVATARQVVAAARENDPRRGSYRADLASLLWILSGRDGDPAALDEAVRIMREAVPAVPPEARGARLHALSLALKRKYELTGDTQALREAVDVARSAVAAGIGEDSARAAANLADDLRMLSERTSDLAMAREAVSLSRAAVAEVRDTDPDGAEIQSVLGSAMTNLAARTGDGRTMSEAVREARKAVAATSAFHPDYLSRVNVLHRALTVQYERSADLSLLGQIVEVSRELAGTAPADHPDRGRYLSYLSGALREVFLNERENNVEGLKESIEHARQAVASTAPNHPDRAATLFGLGDVLSLFFARTQDASALREYSRVYSAVAKMTGTSAGRRIAAAQRAASADLQLGRVRHAAGMVELATDLLPQLGFRDVDRADREHRVAAAHRLPATAAAVAIAAGRPGYAVELLEQTRGIVFSGTLDTREDTAELSRLAADLLPRFEQLRTGINAADHEIAAAASGEHIAGPHPRELAARREELSRQWDDLLDEIRLRPGLAGFQRPTPIAELCRHAAHGPIVSVVADESRAYALIVRDDPGDPVHVVELPEAVTRDAVIEQADAFRQARGVALDQDQPVRARRAAQPRMLEILVWIWENITEPVLKRLGRTGPPLVGEPWPRVWWCPVGVVTLLPLHAAGRHGSPQSADAVLDRVVSSYTPSIRALAHARRAGPATTSALFVGVPEAPGSPPLAGTVKEAALVREFIPSATVLPADDVPVCHTTVAERLPEHGIVHFACHGYADLHNPSASRLLLPDHVADPLTLHAITRQNLNSAQLAYLSACSTTETNQEQADEATHLTAAFQLAGYRNVVGTLWPITDQTALTAACAFYAELTSAGTGPPAPERAALALHHAVRTMRDLTPALPSRWAAYLHSGG